MIVIAGRSWSNCVIWALLFWWRRHRKGHEGHVTFRKSRWGLFPHCCYVEYRASGSIRLVSFKPRSPTKRLFPPPLFRGYTSWGDDPRRQRHPPGGHDDA